MAKKKSGRKASKKAKKGQKYVCDECGLAISVDEGCGCNDVCDIVCCGEQMREGC